MTVLTLHGRARRAKGNAWTLESRARGGLRSLCKALERETAGSGSVAERRLLAPMRAPGRDREQILTNARIVMRDAVIDGTVQIVGGRITAIDSGRTAVPSALDVQRDYLLAGLVDVHTDNLERHLQPRPGVAWPSMAALLAHDQQVAAAGITTVFDSLCVGDRDQGIVRHHEALAESLQAMRRAQANGLLRSAHILHLRCEVSAEGVVDSLSRLIDDPEVGLVSVMDHTPGQRQWADLASWRRFQRSNELSDGELEGIYDRRTRRHVELTGAARCEVAQMCMQRGLALASHDDATIEHVLEAAEFGVTISEFPTTEVAARTARGEGMNIVMGAPNVVLNGSHAGNVSARKLASAGLVDAFASDYVPLSLIQACFVCHRVLGMALPAAAAMVSATPAAMLGLDDRGCIAEGKRADLLWVKALDGMPLVCGVWREGERVV